jgi:rifampicin phosphotransferase
VSSADAASALTFDPPGPGPWEQDSVHFPRAATAYWVETHPAPFARGTADFSSFYGLLIGGLRTEYVNGIAYGQPQPAPEAEIPQRFQRAEEVLAGKLWREQLREWDETSKPNAIAKHRELQAVDPDALSDDELAAYLERCRDHHAAMIAQHMRYTASAMIPTGDFLAHAGEWTGLPPAQLLGLLRGASPVSAGASAQLGRLIAAIRADAGAQELLASDADPAGTLAALSSRNGDVGPAMTEYLDLVGNRLLDGFDICELTVSELPDQLLRSLRTEVAADADESDVEALTAEVRAKVPAEHQAAFDELLGEARLLYRLRDERGVYSDIWASGITRRAVLAAGQRLAGRGAVHEPVHLIDATVGEMQALLTGAGGPSADELAARAARRTSRTAKDAPKTLGPPAPPPPDHPLPPAIGRIMRATGIALGSVFGSSEAESEEHLLRGLAASPGVVEGVARLVDGPADFDRIVQGDILVTVSTSEAFNILLPLLSGLVTDAGGLLSHAAIVSREYGIPGVVGTRDATERIADGARVRVDGNSGEVTVFA